MLVPFHESPFKPDSTPSSVVSEMDAENACTVHNGVSPTDTTDFTSSGPAVPLRDSCISSDSCRYSDSSACREEIDDCSKLLGTTRQSNDAEHHFCKRVEPEQRRKPSQRVKQSTSIEYDTTDAGHELVAVLNFDGTGEKADDVTKGWSDKEEYSNSYNLLLRTDDKYDSKGWERRTVQAADPSSPPRAVVNLTPTGVSALDAFQARVTQQSMQCARLRRCLRAAQLQLVTNHIATQLNRLNRDPQSKQASNSTEFSTNSATRSKSIVQLVRDAAESESVSDCTSSVKGSAADVRAFAMRSDILLRHVTRTYDAEMTESSSDEDDDADYDDVDWAAQSLVRVPASLHHDVHEKYNVHVNTQSTRRLDATDTYWPVDFVETRVAVDRRLDTKLHWLRRRAAITSRARWTCLKLDDLSEQSRCSSALYARLRACERERERVNVQTVQSAMDDPDAADYLNSRCRPLLRLRDARTRHYVTPRTFETKGKNQDCTNTPLIEQLTQFAYDTFHTRLSFVQDVPRSLLKALEVPIYAHSVRKQLESRTSELAGAFKRIKKQVERNAALVRDRLAAFKSARVDQFMSPRALLQCSSGLECNFDIDSSRTHKVDQTLPKKANEHPQSSRPTRSCSSRARIKRRRDIAESESQTSVATNSHLQKSTVANVKQRSTVPDNNIRIFNRKASYNHLRSSLMKSQNHLDYSIGSAIFSRVRVEPEVRSDIATPIWRFNQPSGTDTKLLQSVSDDLTLSGDALNEEEAQELAAMNEGSYCERHARAEQRERDRFDAALQRHTAQRRRSRAASALEKVMPKLEDASSAKSEICSATETVNQDKTDSLPLVHDLTAAVGPRKRKFTRVRTVEYTRSTEPGWPARVFPLNITQLDEMAVADNEARDVDRMATKCRRAVAQQLDELRCPLRSSARRNRLSGSFSRSNGADQPDKPTRANIVQSKVESANEELSRPTAASETITALELNNVEMHYVDGSCQWPSRPTINAIFERPSNRSHSVVPRCVARLRTRARRVRAWDVQRSPVRAYSQTVGRLGCNEREKPVVNCFSPRCTSSVTNLGNAARPNATRLSRRERENQWRQSGGPNAF